MPRACTICTHGSRHAIEKSIVDGVSNRGIAKQFAVGADAVLRHKRDHFSQTLAETMTSSPSAAKPGTVGKRGGDAIGAYVQQKVSTEQAHVVDVFHELFIQLDRLGKLYDAIHEWLSDPEDPEKYFIGARSHEITVLYEDLDDCSPAGAPKRKRAPLDHLLEQIERDGHHVPLRAETKFSDPRDLLVKVSAELRAQMQLRVSIVEKLYNAQEIERFKSAVLDAIGEVDPHVRRTVEDNLRRRQPLPGLTGPPLH